MTTTSARPGSRRRSPRSSATTGRVVVGFDGSVPGWRALRWAANEAQLRQALLEVVLVFDVSLPTVSFGLASVDTPATHKVIEERAQTAVRDAARDVHEGELITHSLAVPGHPGPVLS